MKCKNPLTTHQSANRFTGGDSVIKEYYLLLEKMAKCKCVRNYRGKYETMMDCLQQTDTQQEDK